MSATSACLSLLCTCFIPSTQRKNWRNKARLTLASNRGSLGVLWTYSGSVVVLRSWGFNPQKHSDKHTGTHMSRHTDPSSLDTSTRGSPRPCIKHTLLHRHKSDENIPVNIAKTATAALPFKMFSLHQRGDLPSVPPCRLSKLEKGITCPVKAARIARAKWSCLGLTSHRHPILWKNCYRFTMRKVVNSKEDSVIASTCR